MQRKSRSRSIAQSAWNARPRELDVASVEAIHIRSIVKALKEIGHNVDVVSPAGCDPLVEVIPAMDKGKQILDRRSIFSYISRYCPEILFEFLEILYNIPAYFNLRKAVRKKNIDLIYERYCLFSIASLMISKLYGIPIIYEVNDSSFVSRLRRLRLVSLANYMERIALGKAGYVFAVSNKFKQILVKAGVMEEKIGVAHNAVDQAVFHSKDTRPVNIGLPPQTIVIGFVGLFVKWVGLEMLIRVFGKIHFQFANTHLLLVGGGPEEEGLRKLIDMQQVQSAVTITGIVKHSDIPQYIKKMTICTIPKHESYTSPVKLFEYMAMGKAVVAPAYDSIREVVSHEKNGLLFTPNSEEELQDNLIRLINNVQLLERLGKSAKDKILKHHTWNRNALDIESAAVQLRSDCR